MSKIDLDGLAGAQHVAFMEPHPDVASDPRLNRLVAIVMASSDERHLLWERWKGRLDWVQDTSGWLPQVGTFADMPVALTLDFARISGAMVVFCEPVSVVVHHGMVERWLDAHIRQDGTLRVEMSGFREVVEAIRALAPATAETVG